MQKQDRANIERNREIAWFGKKAPNVIGVVPRPAGLFTVKVAALSPAALCEGGSEEPWDFHYVKTFSGCGSSAAFRISAEARSFMEIVTENVRS